jgi:hypothetical protein
MGPAEVINATIKSTSLEMVHGYLTLWLHLDYGGTGQGFGGISLYHPEREEDFAGSFLYKTLDTVGVSKWEDLRGKHIRVVSDHSKVHKIGHIILDKWFCPATDIKWEKYERSH